VPGTSAIAQRLHARRLKAILVYIHGHGHEETCAIVAPARPDYHEKHRIQEVTDAVLVILKLNLIHIIVHKFTRSSVATRIQERAIAQSEVSLRIEYSLKVQLGEHEANSEERVETFGHAGV